MTPEVYKLCVITKIPDDPETDDGNLCSPLVYRLPPHLALHVLTQGRVPVFSLGEIFVVGVSGREVGGQMRKPDKWDVEYQLVDTVNEAVALSKSLFNEDTRSRFDDAQ